MTLNGISLDQACASGMIAVLQRTFINCLPSIDLEMRFRGTIFCEMDVFTKMLPEQTLIHLLALKQWIVLAYFYISEINFGRFNL